MGQAKVRGDKDTRLRQAIERRATDALTAPPAAACAECDADFDAAVARVLETGCCAFSVNATSTGLVEIHIIRRNDDDESDDSYVVEYTAGYPGSSSGEDDCFYPDSLPGSVQQRRYRYAHGAAAAGASGSVIDYALHELEVAEISDAVRVLSGYSVLGRPTEALFFTTDHREFMRVTPDNVAVIAISIEPGMLRSAALDELSEEDHRGVQKALELAKIAARPTGRVVDSDYVYFD